MTGRLDGADSLAEVNAALRDRFEAFVVREVEHADAEGGQIRRLYVQPILLGFLGERIVEHWHGLELLSYGPGAGEVEDWESFHDADQPPPPLRWLQSEPPEQNVHNSHG